MSNEVTLDNCDAEPIHIPGAIQPHGALLALNPTTYEVVQASMNVGRFTPLEHAELVGQSVERILTIQSFRALVEALAHSNLRDVNPVRLETRAGAHFDGILHREGGLVILELERASATELTFGDFYRRVRKAVGHLREQQRVVELASLAAEEVRAITGFDRVMVYRFAPDASGEVIAESKEAHLDTFAGHRYPASDIPAQARRLYLLNWLRLISDIDYSPSAIEPPRNPLTNAPLDLSFSVLRSVSPIHIEYLRNMGVRASMSISLVVDGALWGLVACHHYSPKFVPYEVRAACEFLGEALSWQIAARERSDMFEQKAEARRVLARLVERMAMHQRPIEGLGADHSLLELVQAAGAAVRHQDGLLVVGETPPQPQLAAFMEWLAKTQTTGLLTTEALTLEHPDAPPLDGVSGVLAVRASEHGREWLVWMRPEIERTVKWAGKPEKTITVKDGVPRLTPRGSFALWAETVRGHSAPWEPWQVDAGLELRSAVLGGIQQRAAELARLNDELRASNFAKDEFLATVSHELRTPLNAMLGWLRLLETGHLPLSKRDQAMETIMRNARSQAQLVEDLLDVSRITSGKMRLDVQSVHPASVVEETIESLQPAAEAKGIRIQPVLDPRAGPISGDPQRLKQIVWNLLANAVKFTPKGGRVQVHLRRVDSYIEIRVSDNGEGIEPSFLPAVFERFRQADGAITRPFKGLGLGLSIVKNLVELHGGRVEATSEGLGKGATFTVRLPVAHVHAEEGGTHPTVSSRPVSLGPAPQLAGLRILVVDDEGDASGLLAATLGAYDVDVVCAASGPEALAAIEAQMPDIVISDIGMPGMDGYELIERIRALPPDRGGRMRAVALTAFARTQDRSRAFRAGFDVYLPKPVDPGELVALLVSLAGRMDRASEAQRPSSQEGARITPQEAARVTPQDGARTTPDVRTQDAPRLTPDARAPSPVPGTITQPLRGIRVLLVEDDEDTRDLMEVIFEREDAVVRSAGSAAEALAVTQQFSPQVIISDLGLPDSDGFTLLRELRASGSIAALVPAVALTGRASREEAKAALLAGFQLHIAKPVDLEDLVSRVAKLVGRSVRK